MANAETLKTTDAAATPDFIQVTTPLWDEVKTVWHDGLLGSDIGSIIIALGIFGGFLLLRGFLARFILARLEDWAAKTKTQIDNRILPCLIPPIKFIPIILGVFFAAQYLDPSPATAAFFSKVVRSMIAGTIFWTVYLAAEPIGHSMKKLERMLTPTMVNWIFKVMKMIVVFVGFAVVLEIWGIKVAPLLAGLGLFGAAVALGAQDFFKNLIAGMSLISEKRFLEGDWIHIEGVVEGTVEDIGFRSTRVRRFDRAPIYVPNSKLTDAVVTNFSRMQFRQIKWTIGLDYDTTTEQLKNITNIIREYIMSDNETFASHEEAPITARIDEFGTASINMKINCFTRKTDYAAWTEAKEELAYKVKEIVEAETGKTFAYPSAGIRIDNLDMEKFEGRDENATEERFVPKSVKTER